MSEQLANLVKGAFLIGLGEVLDLLDVSFHEPKPLLGGLALH